MKVIIWYKAVFLDYPFWRVKYKDDRITYPLYYSEASGLAGTFSAKKYIDYDYARKFIRNTRSE